MSLIKKNITLSIISIFSVVFINFIGMFIVRKLLKLKGEMLSYSMMGLGIGSVLITLGITLYFAFKKTN